MSEKVKGFEDFNIEGEKKKLQKIKRSFKPNSDQQQYTTNTKNVFDEDTRKITAVTKDEVVDDLKSLEEKNEGHYPYFGTNSRFYDRDNDSEEITRKEKEICLKVYEKYRFEMEFYDLEMSFIDWLKK